MNKELLALYSRVHFPTSTNEAAVDPAHVAVLNKEAATLGYTFDNILLSRLRQLSKTEFSSLRNYLLADMSELSGAKFNHATLFKQFPYNTPDQDDYLVRRIFGYLQNALQVQSNHFRILSCGHAIDSRMFDLDEFGACPICQFQVDELDGSESTVLHHFKRLSPLKPVSFADDAFLRERGNALLGRNSSLSPTERALLDSLGSFGLSKPTSVFRENLPYVYRFFNGDVAGLVAGATDVLRIATYLSKSDADLSLKDNVRFKLPTSHKKKLLRLLESLNNIEEDLLRNRERWKRIGHLINPGSAANRAHYPKTAAAFDALRNEPKKIWTFTRAVEKKVRAKTIDGDLLATLVTRPGEFMRRLDFVLRTSKGTKPVLDTLAQAASKVPSKLLFEISKYLEHRKYVGEKRVFIPKGNTNRMQVVDDNRLPITTDVLNQAIVTVDYELVRRFSSLPPMGKVYVDPALANIVMPYNKRGDSATNVATTKGSRYPLSAAEVVRLFVHWTGKIDVDLSVVCYDGNFEFLDQISWTNTRSFSAECIHSGDIQNAPNGASEFIDFNIESFLNHNIRYVAAWVISFRGEAFETFPCFAGFMERDGLKSGEKYEPEAVTLKFDIKTPSTSHLPLVFDLTTRQVIFADISAGVGQGRRVGGNDTKLVTLTKAVTNIVNTKPTVYDVLVPHVAARGQFVARPEDADLSFTLTNLDIEKIAKDYTA